MERGRRRLDVGVHLSGPNTEVVVVQKALGKHVLRDRLKELIVHLVIIRGPVGFVCSKLERVDRASVATFAILRACPRKFGEVLSPWRVRYRRDCWRTNVLEESRCMVDSSYDTSTYPRGQPSVGPSGPRVAWRSRNWLPCFLMQSGGLTTLIRRVLPSVVVGVAMGELAVVTHARELTGGEQTLWGWALGWHVLLVAIAVGIGGLYVLSPYKTAGLALIVCLGVAGLHIYRGIVLPGYEVGALIVGVDADKAPEPAIAGPPMVCVDVSMVGVRGSGETAASSGGYGTVVQAFRSHLQLEIGDSLMVNYTALDYTAAGTDVLIDPLLYSSFFESFEEGADLLTKWIQTQTKECPEQRIVVAGHSQGATVIHMTLPALTLTERNQITHAILFSDPARLVGDSANRGYLSGSDGSFVSVTSAQLPGMPSEVDAESWCFEDDIVCSFTWDPAGLVAFGADSSRFHTLPYQNIAASLAFEVARDLME